MWREALLELFFSTAFVNYELITLGRATKINKGPKPKTKEKSLYFPLFPRRRLLGRVNSSDSWFSDSTAEREGDIVRKLVYYLGIMARLQLNMTTAMEMGVTTSSWWNDINESTFWQDRIFYSLCAVYALVSAVALVSLFCFRTSSI